MSEQGRGFAVVAEEVHNLASRCTTAASDIKELVTDSAGKVQDGSTQVELSGKTLEEIVTSISRVSDIVSEIATASSEQSSGIEQVNLAVSQMDSMTQQNASLVEESAAASHSLEDQAVALKDLVAFFKVGYERLDSRIEAKPQMPNRDADDKSAPALKAPPPLAESVKLAGADGEEWASF